MPALSSRELAERMQIPVVTSLMGKGAMRCIATR